MHGIHGLHHALTDEETEESREDDEGRERKIKGGIQMVYRHRG
jgi:hypothetical protein